jgi:16S rRNA (cytosine1402-N4)-methyltransferase
MLVHSAYHAPVLAAEVIELLRDAERVLDCTLGGGGHSEALLVAGVASVVGVDRDPEALASASRRLHEFAAAGRFSAVESNYATLNELPSLDGMTFDGILLDLGISSHQVDEFERGFTFRPGARLDMRMSSIGATAADLLNDEDEEILESVFKRFGDEPRARGLAREIVRRRETIPFTTSDELVGAIRAVLGSKSGAGDFARLFQAVRIAVNDELPGLTRSLPELRDRLTPGGRLVVITYHSGEDRIVKNFFRDWSAECICPPKHPICTCRGQALGTTLTRRGLVPSEDEVSLNARARSARLRAWQNAK